MKMLLPALAVLSSTAMAADMKFNLEGRFDYVMSTTKHEGTTTATAYEDKRAEFYSSVLRLNSVFTVNENLSGRFRYRFSTAQETSKQNKDLSFQNVDFLYIDHKNQWFTTRIGKHNQVESLGREYFMSGTDYPVSMINPAKTTIVYNAMNTAVYKMITEDADIYHVGASAIYTALQGHTFTLSAFNPQKTTYSDLNEGSTGGTGKGDSKNQKMGLGAYYNGSMMEGLFQPTLGYTQFGIAPETDPASTAANSATHKLMAAGVRSVVAGFTVDADWKQYKRESTAATSNEDKTTSYWANVAYTWDNLTPFVTYLHDKYDAVNAATADYKRDAYSAGLMIKPFKENNFRYHLAWSNDAKKNAVAAGETKTKATLWTAGIKFDL